MIYTEPSEAAPAIADALNQAHRILVLAHENPDGDAIGSMLGLWHALRDRGKEAIALAPPVPPYTRVLPGVEEIVIYEPGMELPRADLVCLLDCSRLQRIGAIYTEHAAALGDLPLVVVDHHVTNEGAGTVNLINPQSASCADLLYRLLLALDAPITPAIASCLLLGLTSDTQSFQMSNTNSQAHEAAADLLRAGADHQSIIRAIVFSTTYETNRLIGLALSQLQREGGLIWTHVSQDMMAASGAGDDATDDVTVQLQRVAGARVCVLFKERPARNQVKISLRAMEDIDVAAIARKWGGGGHTRASGATLDMPLAEAQREVLAVVREVLGQQQ